MADMVDWPEVFRNPGWQYFGDADERYRQALADGLIGLANCERGHKPPENFGKAMVKIGDIVGHPATGGSLLAKAKTLADVKHAS